MIPGWKEEFEAEYLKVLQDVPQATPREFAQRLDISECCAVYWLSELAREGKVRIVAVELVKEGEMPCDIRSIAKCQRKATCPAVSSAEMV